MHLNELQDIAWAIKILNTEYNKMKELVNKESYLKANPELIILMNDVEQLIHKTLLAPSPYALN